MVFSRASMNIFSEPGTIVISFSITTGSISMRHTLPLSVLINQTFFTRRFTGTLEEVFSNHDPSATRDKSFETKISSSISINGAILRDYLFAALRGDIYFNLSLLSIAGREGNISKIFLSM